ncbi:MAG: DUF1273 domain-containing protein [Ruminococcus sp.]|nr:DUF1273 domain-containing protein [Ruminococcus sp.]
MAVFEKAQDFRFDKNTTCCFSGHRPDKLPGNGDVVNSMALRRILSILRLSIEDAIKDGYKTFISGMAPGVDLWAASFIRDIHAKNPEINLVCVLPFREQKKSLHGEALYDYNLLLDSAAQVICLNDKYEAGCMRERNQFMIDNSSRLIAVVNSYRSGTGMTINMAKKQNVDIKIIDVNKNPAVFTD